MEEKPSAPRRPIFPIGAKIDFSPFFRFFLFVVGLVGGISPSQQFDM